MVPGQNFKNIRKYKKLIFFYINWEFEKISISKQRIAFFDERINVGIIKNKVNAKSAFSLGFYI